MNTRIIAAIGRMVCIGAAGIAMSAAAFRNDEKVDVETGPVKAAAIVKHGATPDEDTLWVTIAAGGKSRKWKYHGYSMDAERNATKIEFQQVNGTPYLFVHAYSGGASCCWSLLVFDAQRLRAMGEHISGASSIELIRDQDGCKLGAEFWPDTGERGSGHPVFRCFEGNRFVMSKATPKQR